MAILPSIDRHTPTLRPTHPPCGTQQWRSLLFIHWAVPASVVRPLVPTQLDLDFHEGETFVGLVPFRMQAVRPWNWWPRAAAFRFLETNVRVYVHHRGRPGVYFLSLEAASWLAVQAARKLWGLPYHYAKMNASHQGPAVSPTGDVTQELQHYESARHGDLETFSKITYRIGERLAPSTQGTLQYFLLERYLLFVEREGNILEGQVHHAPYVAHACDIESCEERLIAKAGFTQPSQPPAIAHYSPGVDVEVFPLRAMHFAD